MVLLHGFNCPLYLVIHIVEIWADILVLIAEFPERKIFSTPENGKVYMAQMFNNVLRFKSAPFTRHLWIQRSTVKTL